MDNEKLGKWVLDLVNEVNLGNINTNDLGMAIYYSLTKNRFVNITNHFESIAKDLKVSPHSLLTKYYSKIKSYTDNFLQDISQINQNKNPRNIAENLVIDNITPAELDKTLKNNPKVILRNEPPEQWSPKIWVEYFLQLYREKFDKEYLGRKKLMVMDMTQIITKIEESNIDKKDFKEFIKWVMDYRFDAIIEKYNEFSFKYLMDYFNQFVRQGYKKEQGENKQEKIDIMEQIKYALDVGGLESLLINFGLNVAFRLVSLEEICDKIYLDYKQSNPKDVEKMRKIIMSSQKYRFTEQVDMNFDREKNIQSLLAIYGIVPESYTGEVIPLEGVLLEGAKPDGK